MKQSRTYVTGFWLLPGNVKRDLSHYAATAGQTAELIRGAHLVFYCSGKPEEIAIANSFRPANVDVEIRQIGLADLPGRPLALRALDACERMKDAKPALITGEKGDVHLRRDYEKSGAEAYVNLQSIWLSKVLLTGTTARTLDAPTAVAWVDISLSRIKGLRSGWNIARHKDAADRILCYRTRMSAQGFPVNVSGAFLSGYRGTWGRLLTAYDDAAQTALADAYAHDEETILSLVRRRQPDLFKEIGGPLPHWRRALARLINRVSPDK